MSSNGEPGERGNDGSPQVHRRGSNCTAGRLAKRARRRMAERSRRRNRAAVAAVLCALAVTSCEHPTATERQREINERAAPWQGDYPNANGL